MKSNPKIIQYLNQALGRELIAINQFFLHSKMYHHWGFTKLAGKEYNESIEEMKHADELAARILFLEGLPNFQDLGKLLIGENVKEVLECDLRLELNYVDLLKEGIAFCEQDKDFVSRDLLQKILIAEESHVDWLETQLELIDKMGLENYLQSQAN